jgi:plastocyanin
MNFHVFAVRAVPTSVLALLASIACAAPLTVRVSDASGQPLADAAVYAEPASGQAVPKPVRAAEIEQKGKRFSPLVTVIQTGTEVSFPNNDTVRHHVYSFSPAKIFDIKLYSGVPGKPILFDKPGTVVIGCNIHDQMVAYIQVVSTHYFAKTDASGKATVEGLTPGKYSLKAWHFNLPAGAPIPEQALNFAGTETAATFKLNVKAGAAAN